MRGFGRLKLQLRFERALLQLRVAQFEDDAVGRDVRAGREHDSLDPPSVRAGIHRVSSGISVPEPRTCRTIAPRFTVPIQTVAHGSLRPPNPKRHARPHVVEKSRFFNTLRHAPGPVHCPDRLFVGRVIPFPRQRH
jgi:hypothetical protein